MTYEDTDTRFTGDDVTWKDLDLDSFFKRIDYCFTTIGQEMLYTSLRNNNESEIVDEKRIEQFTNDVEFRKRLSYQLAKLSKSRNSNTSKFMYTSQSVDKYHPFFIFTSLLPMISIFLFIFNPYVALAGSLIGLSINIFVSHKHKNTT